MQTDPPIAFDQFQLSQTYLDKSSDLAIVEQPFKIETIANQISKRDLQSEFELLRAVTETKKHRLKLRVNPILENKKNRYPEQSIYQHSRVKLLNQSTKTEENDINMNSSNFKLANESTRSKEDDYINANYIPSPTATNLIVTQAPLQSTQSDLQSMILQERIDCVVMLCNVVEGGKVRCFDYLDNRQTKLIEEQDGVIQIKEVTIPKGENNTATYTHIHYSEWPDRGVPENINHLAKIISHMMKFKNIAIHCSAGLGRSGVVATLFSIQKQLSQSQDVSVFRTVRRLREHRFGAVQNNEQYGFIYSYLRFINQMEE